MPAQIPNHRRPRAVATFLALTVLSVAGATARLGMAKTAPKPPKAPAAADVSTDDLQRSLRLDTYKILGDSGAARGENIYFYKCWMCHNQYTKGAPLLKDLFQRENLASGDPVNDDNVTAKIKEGGAGMPAFRTSLSDADITDLRAYFHSGKCCVEGENPPANPWYRRRIFAFHAAFSRVKISAQIRYVRIGKTCAKCGHSGTALFDFGGDVVVIYGITRCQVLTLKEVLQ